MHIEPNNELITKRLSLAINYLSEQTIFHHPVVVMSESQTGDSRLLSSFYLDIVDAFGFCGLHGSVPPFAAIWIT
jgi:hypothetical protein